MLHLELIIVRGDPAKPIGYTEFKHNSRSWLQIKKHRTNGSMEIQVMTTHRRIAIVGIKIVLPDL